MTIVSQACRHQVYGNEVQRLTVPLRVQQACRGNVPCFCLEQHNVEKIHRDGPTPQDWSGPRPTHFCAAEFLVSDGFGWGHRRESRLALGLGAFGLALR